MLRYTHRGAERTYFERPDDMPVPLHRLLIERGIGSLEEARRFLNPTTDQLLDPFLMSDMHKAVERIRRAVDRGEHICVYGDYDVDGVCASSVLSLYLESLGADVEVYLPSRHTEGYGLNERAVREIAGRATLMVTVDCGVTSIELVGLAKSLGLDVIVTDHHRPKTNDTGYDLPDCPVVNPLLNDYPFPALCGAGVAWKLVWALSGEIPMQYIDIAALATVADVVSLTKENRVIVKLGLQKINRAPRPGIEQLINVAGLAGKPIAATHIAFQLAPRLNAGGRLDTAMRPLELVKTHDPARAGELARELNDANDARKDVEQYILKTADMQMQGFDFIRHRAIVLAGEDWNPGVIGLAASRVVEKYHYPVILLAGGDTLTGSCRSIEGVDIHAALTGCAEHLVRFGGHKQAAGLTLERSRLEGFIDALDAWLEANCDPDAWIPREEYDTEIDLEMVNPGLVTALEGLQPTGFGNPAPVFRASADVLEARAVGMDGAHLKLLLSRDGHRVNGIAFRMGDRAEELSAGEAPIDTLFVPKLNTYNGVTTAQMEVRALSDADPQARLKANVERENELQFDFLTDILYNKRTVPAPFGAREIEWSEAIDLSAGKPQGTLYAVSELACASRLLERLAIAPDIRFGAPPEDERAFNAVWVCPTQGDIPKGYRRIVLIGVPASSLAGRLPEGCEVLKVREHPGWVHCLPDVDQMRSVFKALCEMARRPLRLSDRSALCALTARNAGCDDLCALASIAAIEDMGLFEIVTDPVAPKLKRLDKRKADPDESRVWRAIRTLRETL